ncbi:serine carboxypeptidase [Schizosaccharomyces cryophilus OY26]|uniref:Carboxypeptidase n=1 Tax=Schizosaccharomyces cryophilus (strain OY26 / ATCC MYA-4695 / CBS 11777 / NBRC 106824 / NRRL Y48691) TaxID=653667 RepID=S9X8V8_SCHCR|nr:serine carboxypeptidase [Schizosaccharomyces cryophilus OY26]EPY50276.1 serine carboxypeptidase [Schizosaccharomyces cryophilus OY26]
MMLSSFTNWIALSSVIALFGLAVADVVDKQKAWLVDTLPGIPEDYKQKMYSGHLGPSEQLNGDLFFWMFESANASYTNRSIIWLNGGPGCSSEDGSLMEVGPLRIGENNTFQLNPGRWDDLGNLLFVDQPKGTGFSYSLDDNFTSDNEKMAEEFSVFFEKFLTEFPERANDTWYIAGESYAGQYIPYVASKIVEKKLAHLGGLAIGNGWIQPVSHYSTYLNYLVEKGRLDLFSEQGQYLHHSWADCMLAIDQMESGSGDVEKCENFLYDIMFMVSDKPGKTCMNMYDISLESSYPLCGMDWPVDLENLTPYLSKPEVMEALHVNTTYVKEWEECSNDVANGYAREGLDSSANIIKDLTSKVPVMLFYGENDFLCNYLSGEDLLKSLEWNGEVGFGNASWFPWFKTMDYTENPAGTYIQARNLTFARIAKASHMVPYDHPMEMKALISAFLDNDIQRLPNNPSANLPDPGNGQHSKWLYLTLLPVGLTVLGLSGIYAGRKFQLFGVKDKSYEALPSSP